MTHQELWKLADQVVDYGEPASTHMMDLKGYRLAQSYLSLSAKLEEVQAEREASRLRAYRQARIFEPSMDGYTGAMATYEAAFGQHDGEPQIMAPEASRGEVVKACPNCGAHLIARGEGPQARFVCGRCDIPFTEPAYYQRVNGLVTP